MRILSWNINGIKTLPQYHPWNTLKECEAILDELDADIICFQEMKSSRQVLPRDVALPGNYCPFFSFPAVKGGYSGVAVYTRSSTAVPLKAEEGLSGRLQPKPPLKAEERISSTYPSIDDVVAYPDKGNNVPPNFDLLDSEGRSLVLDFGLFVLINVYCPNETSDARLSFKMNYHLLLQERVRQLTAAGREVIVLGDINVCATPLDHCDGHLPSNANSFWEHPARVWFHDWLHPTGPMVDVVRTYWQERKGMFTCWNQKIQARESNYGTRIDYILITQGLLKWIKHGDIQPSLKGSDHCPIYIDLHDEIALASGDIIKLRDAMQQGTTVREPPRISAKYWEEFSRKQTKLSSFFSKKADGDKKQTANVSPPVSASTQKLNNPTPSPSPPKEEVSQPEKKSTPPSQLTKKRTLPSSWENGEPSSSKKKPKKTSSRGTNGSSSQELAGKSSSSSASVAARSIEIIEAERDTEQAPKDTQPDKQADDEQLDADYRLACELAAAERDSGGPSPTPPTPSSSQSKASSSQSKAAWSTLFAPVQAPNCTVHREPTKKFTVNKPGPNKGKVFYVCSRPVGPGYDKGKGERLREEVDHQYKCNFFKWSSDVKREATASRSSGLGPT